MISSRPQEEGQRHDPAALRVDRAAAMVGVSLATARRLVASGEWPSFAVGRRRLVAAEGLRQWVDAKIATTQAR